MKVWWRVCERKAPTGIVAVTISVVFMELVAGRQGHRRQLRKTLCGKSYSSLVMYVVLQKV